MPPPERAHFPTGFPGLDWLLTDDGSRTLFSSRLGEAYHSGCGAAAESLHVYLINSGVAAQLQSRRPTRVLEIGFGTGSAFFLTAALAEACQAPLHYTALELDLLPVQIFEDFDCSAFVGLDSLTSVRATDEANGSILPIENVVHQWTAARRELDASQPWHLLGLSQYVQLELILADVREFVDRGNTAYDAVYFDPFSPETSPELWTEAVFEKMFAVLRPLGKLTSYCVKGVIRRKMEGVGFQVQKVAGPIGGKREVLVAIRPEA